MNLHPIIQSTRQIFNDIHYIPTTYSHLRKLREKYRNGETINICFIIQFPEMWNSYKLLYEAIKMDARFSVKILTLPKRNNPDFPDKEFYFDEAFGFFKELGMPVESLLCNNKFRSLKNYNLDYIFVQRPYNDMMPPCYSLSRISKAGLICYVPYSGRLTNGIHLSYELNPSFLMSFFAFFSDCTDSYRYVKSWKDTRRYDELKRVYNIGFPRFDLIKRDVEMRQSNNTRFTWLPRWSLNENNDKSTFLEYVDDILDYFAERKNISLIIRPHPLMFTNFLKNGALTVEQINEIKAKVENMENVEFDQNKDYLDTFKNTDVLLADGSSLLLEFFFTGKPIMCFTEYKDLTQEGDLINDTFIQIRNRDELLTSLESIERFDPKKELREKNLIALLHAQGNSSANICNELINIAKGD